MEISTPEYFLGYYRPWKTDSSLVDSWCNYLKDASLAKYNADIVGNYIQNAADRIGKNVQEQTRAIEHAAQEINIQLQEVGEQLFALNKRMDMSIEQQRLSNFLLADIAGLLRIPDSEKERQRAISLGVNFLVKAKDDSDLYEDALVNLIKAESLMPQDYFVLYRIGCIYLYSPNHIDFAKASDYFLKAAKYAIVDSDESLCRIADAFNSKGEKDFYINSKDIIAESYEKAALSFYCSSDDDNSAIYQEKALKYSSSPERQFTFAKYLFRNQKINSACKYLKKSVEQKPVLMSAIFMDPDFLIQEIVPSIIEELKQEIDSKYIKLLAKWDDFSDEEALNHKKRVEVVRRQDFVTKSQKYSKLSTEPDIHANRLRSLDEKKDAIITEAFRTINLIKNKSVLLREDADAVSLIKDFENLEHAGIFDIESEFNKVKKRYESCLVKVGSRYAGGIVIFINSENTGGLVVAEKKIGKARWGSPQNITRWNSIPLEIDDVSGVSKTNHIVKYYSPSKDTAAFFCKQCKLNGYEDWFLPSIKEADYFPDEVKKGYVFWTSDFSRYGSYGPMVYDRGAKLFHGFTQDPDEERFVIPVRVFGAYCIDKDDSRLIKEKTPEIKSGTRAHGGCYIATCVYGSYDCPEVWTLRRFRDYTLTETWYGRLFIKTYYAISPTLVNWFGSFDWFKRMWRASLDKFVATLNSKGFMDTPYQDLF